MSKGSAQKVIFGLLCLEGAIISFNIASIAAVIQPIAQDLHKNSFEVMRIISFYMVPYGLAALIYAPLVKRYPVKLIKIFCLLIFALASLACGLSRSLFMLLASRIFTGIAAASTTPIALILIGQIFPQEIRGRMVGGFFSATFVSSLTGVLLSGILPWQHLFILPAIFALLNIALVLLFFDGSTPSLDKLRISLTINPEPIRLRSGLSPEQGRRTERSRRIDFKTKLEYDFEVSYVSIMQERRCLSLFLYILLLSLVYHGIYNWLGVYFSSLGHSQVRISLLLSLVGFSGIFGQLFGGWVTDKKGRVFTASCGLIILSLATFSLVGSISFRYLACVLFIFGIGWTMNHNAVSTALTDLPDRYRAELASLNSAVRFSSGGIGVGLAGIFIQRSFALTFLGLGVIILGLAGITNRILNVGADS